MYDPIFTNLPSIGYFPASSLTKKERDLSAEFADLGLERELPGGTYSRTIVKGLFSMYPDGEDMRNKDNLGFDSIKCT